MVTTAKQVILEAARAVEIADRIRPQLDSHAAVVGAFDGSAHAEQRSQLAGKRERAEACKRDAEAVSQSQANSTDLDAIAEPSARMHARLAEVQSLVATLERWEDKSAADLVRAFEEKKKREEDERGRAEDEYRRRQTVARAYVSANTFAQLFDELLETAIARTQDPGDQRKATANVYRDILNWDIEIAELTPESGKAYIRIRSLVLEAVGLLESMSNASHAQGEFRRLRSALARSWRRINNQRPADMPAEGPVGDVPPE